MFNLSTASRELREAARRIGIREGNWIPVNAGTRVEDLDDNQEVARVYDLLGRCVPITAGDLRDLDPNTEE